MAKNDGLSFYTKEKKIKKEYIKLVLGWIFTVIIAVFSAFVFARFFGNTTKVVGESMMPTIQENSYVCYNSLVYLGTSPKVNDVIVFLPKGNERSHYYIKRVVAVPGDKVLIKDGLLYVNGEISPVIFPYITDAGIAQNEIELGEDEFFCLGDAVTKSEDSRNANIGIVKRKYILGRIWCSFIIENKSIKMFRMV